MALTGTHPATKCQLPLCLHQGVITPVEKGRIAEDQEVSGLPVDPSPAPLAAMGMLVSSNLPPPLLPCSTGALKVEAESLVSLLSHAFWEKVKPLQALLVSMGPCCRAEQY